MTSFNKEYNGNLRLNSVSFDSLTQMFEGNPEEYDPADNESNKMYIGKIGKYSENSYFWNSYWNAATVQIEFDNGHSMVVMVDDVETTELPATEEYYLPTLDQKDDTSNFKPLTDSEKEFADKLILAMLTGKSDMTTFQLQCIVDEAIILSIYKNQMFNRGWNQNVEIKDEY